MTVLFWDQCQSSVGCNELAPGVIFMLNSLTGLSLLTLPYGFGEAGLLLGALIILGCMIISFMTATFMCDWLRHGNHTLKA